MDNQGKGYQKRLDQNQKPLAENNWVWSPTGKINMHMPEMWGYVQFSENYPDNKTSFKRNPDEDIKWVLWQLYWQQLKFYKQHGQYTSDINDFDIPDVNTCSFKPTIYISPFSFEITNPSCHESGNWIINKEGKVEIFKLITGE